MAENIPEIIPNKQKYITLKTIEGKIYQFNIEAINSPHLDDTLLSLNFINTKFDNPQTIELCFYENLMKYLIPIIRQGKLLIPPVELIDDLGDLVQYLGGANSLWMKLAEILKSEIIIDKYGNVFNMRSSENPMLNVIFDTTNAFYYYNRTPDNEHNLIKQLLSDFTINNTQPEIYTIPTERRGCVTCCMKPFCKAKTLFSFKISMKFKKKTYMGGFGFVSKVHYDSQETDNTLLLQYINSKISDEISNQVPNEPNLESVVVYIGRHDFSS